MTTYLVTGVAGFIGSHVAKRLLERGDVVIGIDNLNDYYDPALKRLRLKEVIPDAQSFEWHCIDFSCFDDLLALPVVDKICHLGAQAGVRYSLANPWAYTKSNVEGTMNIFEYARQFKISDIIYASSSSVYGGNKKVPFSVEDNVDQPVSLYAATKRSNELMAHTYHHLFGFNVTGLRFFTVYGPWGRPDMALFKFTNKIVQGKPIDVYNYGKMQRDFTYIDDIVDGVISALDHSYPYEIFNLGNSDSIELGYFIECLEKELGQEAEKNMMPIQPGDVPITFADIEYSRKKLDFDPKVKIEEGVHRFIEWYKEWILPLQNK